MFNAFADDAKQFARELAAEGGLWLLMGLLILVSLGFIIAATYLALASSMGPIAACAILAGVLLIAAGATAIILRQREPVLTRDNEGRAEQSAGALPFGLDATQAAAMLPTVLSVLSLTKRAARGVGRNLPVVVLSAVLFWLFNSGRDQAEVATAEASDGMAMPPTGPGAQA